MKNKFSNKKIDYDGSQLRSHFALDDLGVAGDSVVSFIGACAVKEHMVDIEDSRKKEFIYSDSMLHFIIEHFDADLEKSIFRKRLFLSIIMEEIHKKTRVSRLRRIGNGLYDGNKKLTVAVATVSPVSSLIHVGLNISRTGVPIPVACLKDYGIDPKKLACEVMKKYCAEIESVYISKAKVKSVS